MKIAVSDLVTERFLIRQPVSFRRCKLFLILSLFGCCLESPGHAQPILEKKTEYGTGIQVALGLHQFHNTCLSFRVFFISGKFFKGLHKEENSNGLQFTKDHAQFHNFPDRLMVDVQVTMLKCHLVKDPPFGYGEGLLSEPSYELKWQEPTGSVKPVILLSSRQRHLAIGMRWDYFLELSSRDVPLTNNLLGDLSLRKGTTHIRFSASLHDNAFQHDRD